MSTPESINPWMKYYLCYVGLEVFINGNSVCGEGSMGFGDTDIRGSGVSKTEK